MLVTTVENFSLQPGAPSKLGLGGVYSRGFLMTIDNLNLQRDNEANDTQYDHRAYDSSAAWGRVASLCPARLFVCFPDSSCTTALGRDSGRNRADHARR